MKKILSTREKGSLEKAFIRIEKFKSEFAKTSLFADLNTQFPIMEIFEMNNGKFGISTVQLAYEEWTQPVAVEEKRADFTKDLNKLISGDYVLVPKQPTQEMIVSALAVIATGIGTDQIIVEVIKCWEKMIEAAQGFSL